MSELDDIKKLLLDMKKEIDTLKAKPNKIKRKTKRKTTKKVKKDVEKIDTLPVKSNIILPGDQKFVTTTKDSRERTGTKLSGLQRGLKPTFLDDPKERANLIKENAIIKAKREAPTRRDPVRFVRVVCHVCHREENVSPSLVPPGYGGSDGALYRCNNCR